jgi:carbamoyl-phosphate synthase large subunit
MNILLSCIGKRGYIADYFREALPSSGKIIGTSNSEWTPGFASCDISLVLPPIESDEYVPFLLDQCRKYDVRGLLSLFDPDVYKLSYYRNNFISFGVIPIIPEQVPTSICFDKLKTYKFLTDINIASPITTDSLFEAVEWLKIECLFFPLIVKPRFGFGSADTFVARNISELKVFFRYAPEMIIQQYIDADAINVDGLGDLSSRPISVVPWRKLLSRMGETERSITIEADDVVELGKNLITKVGIIGPFDADLFKDKNGKLWVLEVNPRFGGGYPVSQLAKANFPHFIIRMLNGDVFEEFHDCYTRGVTMMKRLQIINGPMSVKE